MYAIVEVKGCQCRVTADELVRVPRMEAEVGAEVSFDRVMLLSDGQKVEVGTPYSAAGPSRPRWSGTARTRRSSCSRKKDGRTIDGRRDTASSTPRSASRRLAVGSLGAAVFVRGEIEWRIRKVLGAQRTVGTARASDWESNATPARV